MAPKKKSLTFFIGYVVLVIVVGTAFVGLGLAYFLRLFPEFVGRGNWNALVPAGPTAVKSMLVIDDRIIMAGLQPRDSKNGGLVISTDHGTTWQPQAGVPDTNEVTSIIHTSSSPSVIYVSLFDNGQNGRGGIYLTHNQGSTWEKVSNFKPVTDVRSLVIVPGQIDVLLAGTVENGIYASLDGGLSWEARNSGLNSLKIQDLAVNQLNPNVVFAATLSGLYRSGNRAESWTPCQLSGPSETVMCLQVVPHPDDASIVYALERPQGEKTLIWRSADAGKTWQQCSWKGLPHEFHPRCLRVSPLEHDTLYIGTVYDGVYRSEDQGASWSSMNRGLPHTENNIIIHTLAFLNDEELLLLAGTDYKGQIYASPVSVSWAQKLVRKLP